MAPPGKNKLLTPPPLAFVLCMVPVGKFLLCTEHHVDYMWQLCYKTHQRPRDQPEPASPPNETTQNVTCDFWFLAHWSIFWSDANIVRMTSFVRVFQKQITVEKQICFTLWQSYGLRLVKFRHTNDLVKIRERPWFGLELRWIKRSFVVIITTNT